MNLNQAECEMPAVERIAEYGNLPQEKSSHNNRVPEVWPRKSSGIEVKNLVFKYRPELETVLGGVSFEVKPNEKIGIVGRTGAGKSSIAVALFRLVEAQEGSQIVIDGVDITKVSLETARKALAIIPQDPFLFSGTLRECLCPYSQAKAEGLTLSGIQRIPDERLWSVLDSVHMGDFFRKQSEGLDFKIAPNGDNLSAGQRQLICVARALLKECSCLILDEATAQVDKETDKLIQTTLRSKLSGTSILAIAHRIDTIIDFDRIIVMDKGVVAEFDTPAALLDAQGVFYQMVMATGEEQSQKLSKIAHEKIDLLQLANE